MDLLSLMARTAPRVSSRTSAANPNAVPRIGSASPAVSPPEPAKIGARHRVQLVLFALRTALARLS